MNTEPSDAYEELTQLHQKHTTEPGINYYHEWLKAIETYSKNKKQSLADLAIDAANLAIRIASSEAFLSDPLVKAAILDASPNFDFSNPPIGDELRGVINSAKGKYFEYLVVDKLNNGERVGDVVLPKGFTATLAEKWNQPRWDVTILDSQGYVAEYLQLKATDDMGYIKEALERYPEISILATDEVGDVVIDGVRVLNSDITNEWLEEQVNQFLEPSASFSDVFLEAFNPLLSLGMIVGTEGYRVYFSEKDVHAAIKSTSFRASKSILAQGVGAAVFAMGGGWFALPSSIFVSLVMNHMMELYETSQLLHQSKLHLLQLRIAQQEAHLLKGV